MLFKRVLFILASLSLTINAYSSQLDEATFSQDLQKAFDSVPVEKLSMLKGDEYI
jgi:hypothetical protein